uniref:Uncharacterized protein n=1 Tax=Arundo donax TaxID=35708 RepID=A0A0A9H188_ARUDO
MANTPRSPR